MHCLRFYYVNYFNKKVCLASKAHPEMYSTCCHTAPFTQRKEVQIRIIVLCVKKEIFSCVTSIFYHIFNQQSSIFTIQLTLNSLYQIKLKLSHLRFGLGFFLSQKINANANGYTRIYLISIPSINSSKVISKIFNIFTIL